MSESLSNPPGGSEPSLNRLAPPRPTIRIANNAISFPYRVDFIDTV